MCCLFQFPVRLLFVLDYKVLGPGTAVGSFSKLPGGRKISRLLLREREKGDLHWMIIHTVKERSVTWTGSLVIPHAPFSNTVSLCFFHMC